MRGRLDSSGVLHDVGWQNPQLAMDGALSPDRMFTVTTDCALRAAKEQRAAADHEREKLNRLIPGLGRLP